MVTGITDIPIMEDITAVIGEILIMEMSMCSIIIIGARDTAVMPIYIEKGRVIPVLQIIPPEPGPV